MALAIGALAAASAGAATAGTVRVGPLTLAGDVRPRHVAWTRDFATRMPLPRARITLGGEYLFGGAAYEHDERTLYLPRGAGWSYADQRLLLAHELGHVADFHQLTPSQRNAFKQLAGVPSCSWWGGYCFTQRYDELIAVPPGEMLAEQYAACAVGLTRRQVEDAGLVTYGWLPDPAIEAQLCQAIAHWLR